MMAVKTALPSGPVLDALKKTRLEIERAIPVMTLTAALYARFRSRREANFADKVISAMRRGFGGHAEASGEAKSKS